MPLRQAFLWPSLEIIVALDAWISSLRIGASDLSSDGRAGLRARHWIARTVSLLDKMAGTEARPTGLVR